MKKIQDSKSKEFFIDLYETYAKPVYAVAYSILKNKGQAEDVVQDTFVKVMPYLERLQNASEYQVKSFLSRTSRNEAINKYRKNQRESGFFAKGVDSEMKADKTVIFPGIQGVEEREFLKQIMEHLDVRSREIVLYRCFYELSYREIAEVLEITEAAAMKRFERAKRQIQNIEGVEYYG